MGRTPNRVTTFPCNGPQRVLIYSPNLKQPNPNNPFPTNNLPNGSLPSWRVIFPREQVSVFLPDVNAQGADEEGYFPINALYAQACGCRPTECEDAYVFVDDGLSR